jgi:hypothetical protein
MTFAWFRKYQKPIMWVVVVMSVLIFATFSGFGDIQAMLTQSSTEIYGEFDVHSTGKRHKVTTAEFSGVRQNMSRFAYAFSQQRDVPEPDVWAHVIALAEGRGAGIDASDRDVNSIVEAMFGGQTVTRELYTMVWRDRLGFPSAREMERFLHDQVVGARWEQFEVAAAGLVNADDIYLRWRQDNERFDYDALVIPDLTDDQIPAPSDEDLQKLWDDTPEAVRAATYVEPRRVDIVYAWAPLAAGEGAPPDDKLAAVPEPTPEEVEQRFDTIGDTRWPDATELTDEIKAAIAHELKVIAAARKAHEAFSAAEEKTAESFRKAAEEAGLTVQDPEGLLGTDELTALPDIGSETLPLWLAREEVGTAYFGYPYSADDLDVHLVLVQAEEPSRPLTFEESREQLVKSWRDGRRDKPARDFREALRKATRELPECATVIAPLQEAANQRADEAAAALPPEATDEDRAAARKQVLDAADRGELAARVAEFEHLAWDKVPHPEGARVINFAGVPRSYVRKPSGDEEPTSVERQLKVSSAVFRLGVNAVSEPVRHAPSSSTAIVIVRSRSFPERSEMLADPAGMDTSRRQLSAQREAEARNALAPESLMASRNLKVAVIEPRQPGQPAPQPPPDF